MRLDVTQQLRMEQQMKLAPRIIQAMEILQLPMLALQERIEAEMEANPVLEQAPPEETGETYEPEDVGTDRGESDMVVSEDNHNSDDFERLADFSDEYSDFGGDFVASSAPARSVEVGGRDRKLDAMANTPSHGEALDEYLLHQWTLMDMPDAICQAGELIITNLDIDGYLRVPLVELSQKTDPPTDPGVLMEALVLVQGLDPTGVAARDMKECLILQLRAEEAAGRDVSLEILLVSRYLREIEMNHLPQIARRTGKTLEEVKSAIENLSHLNPRPGTLIGDRTVPIVVPDIIVALDGDGEPAVAMADGNTPRLCISDSYRRLARDRKTDRDAKAFLQKNIRSAQWIMEAIAQRRYTVQRVAEEVFAVQKDFLTEGPEALKPLPMADVANKVHVHVATVSRAVAGKHVQTPRGIYPLRMFFSGGTTTAEGDDVSWDAVKAKLQEVVDNENKAKPLNDDQLAEALQAKGVTIARRTVAKYRKLMDIPPARKRKQY